MYCSNKIPSHPPVWGEELVLLLCNLGWSLQPSTHPQGPGSRPECTGTNKHIIATFIKILKCSGVKAENTNIIQHENISSHNTSLHCEWDFLDFIMNRQKSNLQHNFSILPLVVKLFSSSEPENQCSLIRHKANLMKFELSGHFGFLCYSFLNIVTGWWKRDLCIFSFWFISTRG